MPEREVLIARARQLRIAADLPTSQIASQLGVARSTVRGWLNGLPEATGGRRPRAKDQLRQQALGLRRTGWAVPEIAEELGVARSTAFRWLRDLPLDADSTRGRVRREAARAAAEHRWRSHRREVAASRERVVGDFADRIGGLTARDIMVVGAALYWCEGAKAKPWRRWVPVTFVNSDPGLVKLFLAFLRSMGVDDGRVNYRVYIHDSADASSAVMWWAQQLAVSAEFFQRTTVKKHRPTTNRRNVGTDYHGCLAVTVRRGRELYWRIEGIMRGLTASGRHAPDGSP